MNNYCTYVLLEGGVWGVYALGVVIIIVDAIKIMATSCAGVI